MLDVTTEVK